MNSIRSFIASSMRGSASLLGATFSFLLWDGIVSSIWVSLGLPMTGWALLPLFILVLIPGYWSWEGLRFLGQCALGILSDIIGRDITGWDASRIEEHWDNIRSSEARKMARSLEKEA